MSAGGIDPRLRMAIDASVGWYEDLFALHGVPSTLENGLWSALGAPPPLHSDAVVVEPWVTAEEVATRLAGRPHAGFKDSFASVDASGAGMSVLFSASWMHREPEASDDGSRPGAWSVVRTRDELAEWTGGHDTGAVLLPGLLERAHFVILARRQGGAMVAGAVARLGSGAVDVSNVHAAPGHSVDWAELAAVVNARFPGRPLVGYESGDDLRAAVAGGFTPVGDLRVWVR